MNIYSGFRIKRSQDLFPALDHFSKLGSAFASDLITHRLAVDIVDAVDERTFLGNKDSTSVSKIWENIQSSHNSVRRDHIRHPRYDFDAEISIRSYEDHLYLILHAENVDFQKLFKKTPGVQYWPYYDVEKPPISKRKWRKRQKIWHTVLKDKEGFRFPLAFQLLPEILPYPKFQNVVKAMPSLEQRSLAIAKKLSLHQTCISIENATSAQIIEMVTEHHEWSQTSDGIQTLSDIAARLFDDIKPINSLKEADSYLRY